MHQGQADIRRASPLRSSHPATFFCGDLSWNNFYGHSLPATIQEGQLSVTGGRMCRSPGKLPRRLAQEQCGQVNRPLRKWSEKCQRAIKHQHNTTQQAGWHYLTNHGTSGMSHEPLLASKPMTALCSYLYIINLNIIILKLDSENAFSWNIVWHKKN